MENSDSHSARRKNDKENLQKRTINEDDSLWYLIWSCRVIGVRTRIQEKVKRLE
jgi:hypothetical protein